MVALLDALRRLPSDAILDDGNRIASVGTFLAEAAPPAADDFVIVVRFDGTHAVHRDVHGTVDPVPAYVEHGGRQACPFCRQRATAQVAATATRR